MPEPMVVPTPTAMPNPAPSTRSKWPLRGWGAVKRLPIRLHLGSLEPITRLPNPSMNTIASKRGHVRDQRRRQVFIGKKFHTEFRLPSRDGVPKISVGALEVDSPSESRVAQGRNNKRMVELGKVSGEISASNSYQRIYLKLLLSSENGTILLRKNRILGAHFDDRSLTI